MDLVQRMGLMVAWKGKSYKFECFVLNWWQWWPTGRAAISGEAWCDCSAARNLDWVRKYLIELVGIGELIDTTVMGLTLLKLRVNR